MGRVNGSNGRRPIHLSQEDVRLLSWFLSHGQVMFERSSMSAQLDRAHMYGYAVEEPAQQLWKLVGSKLEPVRGKAIRVRSHQTHDSRLIGSVGPGYDARPTAEKNQGVSVPGDDDTLRTRFTDVGRRLKAVAEESPMASSALELYYGDRGARYDGGRPGAIFALYICTAAGRELLKRDTVESKAREGAPQLAMADYLRLENQAAQEWGQTVLRPNEEPKNKQQRTKPHPKRWRTLLLQSCELQSRRLLSASAAVWNAYE